MGTLGNCVSRTIIRLKLYKHAYVLPCRCSNTLPNKTVEKHRKSELNPEREIEETKPERKDAAPRDYKFVYPEFLPNPNVYYRDRICEKLEHEDMFRRRSRINLPEFYVGSIMAVVVSDLYAPGKRNRFVGVCIQRSGNGLRANFTLRNVVDGQGMEITYELYNPTVQAIEVLKLEKRLDEQLYYLRDALPEHSTIPFDYESVPHPPGAPIPINPIKVKLKPRPWLERWERQELQGVQDLGLPQRFYDRAKEVEKPWEKHDLMKEYRESINEDEANEIMERVYTKMTEVEQKLGRRWGKLDT